MPKRKTLRFMVDMDLANWMEAIRAKTGLSISEQIRQAIRRWLESREWPITPRRAKKTSRFGD